jgi:hypothetical protein
MERRNDREVKHMSEKQESLLKELLDREELKNGERLLFGKILETRVETSKDASVLISHILGLLDFRQHFGEQ